MTVLVLLLQGDLYPVVTPITGSGLIAPSGLQGSPPGPFRLRRSSVEVGGVRCCGEWA